MDGLDGWPPKVHGGNGCRSCGQPIPEGPTLADVCGDCWAIVKGKLDSAADAQHALLGDPDLHGSVTLKLHRGEAAVLEALLMEYAELRLAECERNPPDMDGVKHMTTQLRTLTAYRLVQILDKELTE